MSERIGSGGEREVSCSACREWKPRTVEFFSTQRGGDGLKARCRACEAAAARQRRLAIQEGWYVPLRERAKRCPRCERSFPRSEEFFYVSKRAPDGSVVKLDGWCRECRRAAIKAGRERNRDAKRVREAELRAARRADPAKVAHDREVRRRYIARVKADPGLSRRDAELRRMAYRLRREAAGNELLVPRRDVAVDAEAGGLLPVEPLASYLEDRVVTMGVWDRARRRVPYDPTSAVLPPVTFEEIARKWLLGERRLRTLLCREVESLRHDVADRICTYGLGDPGLFRELYPELYEDVPSVRDRSWEAASLVWEEVRDTPAGVERLAERWGVSTLAVRFVIFGRKRIPLDELDEIRAVIAGE